MSSTQGFLDRSRTLSKVVKFAGLALLGAGLVLGGCNNKLKEENDALTKESAELRQAKTEAETQKGALEQRVAQLTNENNQVNNQLQSTRAQAQSPAAQQFTGSDNGNDTTYGRPSKFGRGQGSSAGNSRGGERTIEISGDVLFGPGQASLKPNAKHELDRVISDLRNARSVVVEGHTDSDPIRKASARYKSNESLSKARADSVRDYLVSKGVSKSKISTVGKGASEPRKSKAESRRVDIVVVE